MVVCKFFLQGTCKFGDFCKFDHQLSDNYTTYQNQNATSILRQPTFGAQAIKPPATSSNVDTTTLVKSVVNDMTSAEKGGQWLLSCYAPFKEKPIFPGFEDQSFEEIRLGFYEAVKNGTLDQYKQQIQVMLQQAVMKLKSLQTPSPDIVNVLKTIYNTPPSSQAGVFGDSTAFASSSSTNTSSVFALQPGSSIFAQTNQNMFAKPVQTPGGFVNTPSSIFASQNSGGQSPFSNQPQAPSNSIFAQTNANVGGQPNACSIFGDQQTAAQPGGSVFGDPTGGSAFGPQVGVQPGNSFFSNQSQTGSIFARQAPTQPPTGIFTGQQATVQSMPGSIFSGGPPSNTVFAAQQNSANPNFVPQPLQQATNSPFGVQPQVQQNSPFAQNNPGPFSPTSPTNIFGPPPNAQVIPTFVQNLPQPAPNAFAPNQPTNASVFPQQSNVFNQQNQATNSPFSQQDIKNVGAQGHSASIFGNSHQIESNSVLGQREEVDESLYSKIEDLTAEEIKWFESGDLDDLNIPDRPPTYQMCFTI